MIERKGSAVSPTDHRDALSCPMANDQWTTYWRDGVETSFGSQSPAWYERSVVSFWRDRFRELADGSSVLDVAAGNGAVARLAVEAGKDQGNALSVTATDKAELSPALEKDPLLAGIDFHSRMPAERLDLQKESFDLVCSQFGIEYSSPDKALPEIFQVLKPGGDFIILAHNNDSMICANSREEMQQYREVLKSRGYFEKLRQLIAAMGEIGSRADLQKLAANPRSEKHREAFNRLVGKLMSKFPQGVVVAHLLSQTNLLFKERVVSPLKAKLAYIDAMEGATKSGQQRLVDLLNAALDQRDLERLKGSAEAAGFRIVAVETLEDGTAGLLAWVIKLKRPVKGE